MKPNSATNIGTSSAAVRPQSENPRKRKKKPKKSRPIIKPTTGSTAKKWQVKKIKTPKQKAEIKDEPAEPAEEVVDSSDETDSSDEEQLYLAQAKGIMRPPRVTKLNPVVEALKEEILRSKEDDSDVEDEIEEEQTEEESSEDDQASGDSGAEYGETIEDLMEGREEKEEDEVVEAIKKAAEPAERTKPPDIHLDDMVVDINFHPDEELLAIGTIEGNVYIYRYNNEETEIEQHLTHHKKAIRAVQFSEEGNLLFTASRDKSICIVDVEMGKVRDNFAKAHSSPVYSLLCMDPNVWASGDDDGVVKVWDLRRSTGKPVVEFKEMEEFVSSMTTDSNGRLLLCTSGEGTLTAFNTRAKKMDTQSELYESEMNCVGLVRQDTKVVTGLGNGMMYIFDWGSFGYHSDSFGDHPDAVNCILPVADNIVITGCEDGKLRAINLFPHRYMGVVGHHDGFPVERLDISTDGHVIASSSHDGIVRFWNIGFFEDEDAVARTANSKKSLRNRKRSLRKEKLDYQLPSSRFKNVSEFFESMANEDE